MAYRVIYKFVFENKLRNINLKPVFFEHLRIINLKVKISGTLARVDSPLLGIGQCGSWDRPEQSAFYCHDPDDDWSLRKESSGWFRHPPNSKEQAKGNG